MEVSLAENGILVEGKTVGIYSEETDSEPQVTFSHPRKILVTIVVVPRVYCVGGLLVASAFDE